MADDGGGTPHENFQIGNKKIIFEVGCFVELNGKYMTDTAIQSQIVTIKNATKKALLSKESAIKFLSDAGILKLKKTSKKKEK